MIQSVTQKPYTKPSVKKRLVTLPSIRRAWLYGWRMLFVGAILLLQDWTFAALGEPHLLRTAEPANHLAVAISLAAAEAKPDAAPSTPAALTKSAVEKTQIPIKPLLPQVKPQPEIKPEVTTTRATVAPVVKPASVAKRPRPAVVTPPPVSNIRKPVTDRPDKKELSALAAQHPIRTNDSDEHRAHKSSAYNNNAQKNTLHKNNTQNSLASSPGSRTPIITKPVFAAQPVPPRYPAVARKRGQEGTVWLDIWLDEQGNKSRLEITQSSGLTLLDASALKAVSRWQFKPYVKDGIRTASRVRIPVVFSLN